MPSPKKPAKAKKPARPQFGDWDAPRVTALLVLADGTVIEGFGLGAREHLLQGMARAAPVLRKAVR